MPKYLHIHQEYQPIPAVMDDSLEADIYDESLKEYHDRKLLITDEVLPRYNFGSFEIKPDGHLEYIAGNYDSTD
jgi:hypothetical protein